MANQVDRQSIQVFEKCGVSPPHGSVPSPTSVPLAFFDLPWFLCGCPVQRIFFYEFPHSTQHFYQTVLPDLKHSLSLTLQHFFPFASKLVFPPKPHIPYILYSHGDSVSFTVAESTAHNYFSNLVSDSPRDVRDVHPLVPVLPSPHTLEDGTMLVPLMAIQVTVMSSSGFSICITFRHVAADGRAFHHFMKFWSSLCREMLRTNVNLASIQGLLPLPLHNRDIIEDPKELKLIFLEELWNCSPESMSFREQVLDDVLSDKVRFTCVLSPDQVEKLKKWVSIQCTNKGLGKLHISTFVITCSLMWICKEKSEEITSTVFNDDELCHLTFLADCRNHSEFSIPSTYFGNCLLLNTVSLERSKLLGENGIVEAAVAIESKVRDFKSEASKGAETLMLKFKELSKLGQHVIIAASPRFGVYETDFGWGKPKRSEVLHIELSGIISLSDCRDEEGGAEVGLALKRNQVNNFNVILEEHLRSIEIR